jgi:protein-arginine kinase activator protein McsA
MEENSTKITDEQMAAFLEGNLSTEEMEMMLCALCDSPELRSVLSIAERVDEDLEENTQLYSILPISRMAAKSKGHLCDLQCEEWILAKRGMAADHASLSEQALQNRWLRDKGTPLHHMGRLLEANGLQVSRRYDATLDDIKDALKTKSDIIVVVDNAVLVGKGMREDDFHAVTVISTSDATIRIFDPAVGTPYEECMASHFMKAWKVSSNYMVVVNASDFTYDPTPINVDNVSYPDDLIDLREAIAENTQEVWASARMADGWSYGPVRDDKRKEHPDLVPYSRLSEGEKEYNRMLADTTIKIVRKFGFDLVKSRDTETYHILMHRLLHSDQEYRCSQCGTVVFKANKYCAECGRRLDETDFL